MNEQQYIPASEAGTILLETFNSGDVQKSIEKISEYRKCMTNPHIGAEYVGWVSEPINLTKLHQSLIEHLHIPPKLLAIKRIQMGRSRRADLLTLAMENAIKKVHP